MWHDAVVSRWNIVDPKVAAWLLDADHPPVTFQQTVDRWMDVDRKSADQVRACCPAYRRVHGAFLLSKIFRLSNTLLIILIVDHSQ